MPAMPGDVTDWSPLDGLSAAHLFDHAAGYAAMARTARTVDVRDALDLLALRYAVLTAQHEVEEQRVTRRSEVSLNIQPALLRRWSVTSGGQLKRTGTPHDPAPTDV
jgi:hypothetical protein